MLSKVELFQRIDALPYPLKAQAIDLALGIYGQSGILPLASFVEKTTRHKLDPWQLNLCNLLETLVDSRGRRLLIAAPPQGGKSIIVSQRFPAWLIAQKPTHRVKLACYNITHATRFGRIVRDLMQSEEYAEMFPNPALKLPNISSTEEWSTSARSALRDGQPSFKALGLATGFVGQGADTLIIDDPYASPQDAYSPIINASTHGFWSDTAKPRLNDDTNVVVMFHRYTEADLAGWLMETESDEWELIRYAAIADGDYTHPVTGKTYPDPMGRAEGEKFSPRFSDEWYETQQKNTFIWLSQFQGRPTARVGGMFKLHQLPIVPAAPALARRVRYWDLGGSDSKKADYSVGCLMSKTPEGLFYIEDVERGQWSPKERNEHIRATADADKKEFGNIATWIEKVPGLAVEVIDNIVRELAGFTVHTEMAKNDKVTRADPLASQCEANNVKVVAGPWNAAFRSELTAFPNGKNDDQVDAASGAFSKIAGPDEDRILFA